MLAQTSLQHVALPRHQPLLRHRRRRRFADHGGPVAYVRRRFVPQPERFQIVAGAYGPAGRAARQHRRPVSGRPDAVLAPVRRQPGHARLGMLTETLGASCASPCPTASAGARAVNQGFYLTLMMGGFSASPVPQAVIDALDVRAGHDHRGQPGRLPAEVRLGQELAARHAAGGWVLRSAPARHRRRHRQRLDRSADGRHHHQAGSDARPAPPASRPSRSPDSTSPR